MTKGFIQDSKSRAMELFWVTARQVVWRSQPHGGACGQEKKEAPQKTSVNHDHPRR